MGERLYRYCRTIFLTWLTLFCLLVLICFRSTGWDALSQKPQPVAEALPIAVEPVPQVQVEAKPSPPPPPPSLEPLAIGNLPGEGTLGKPEFAGDRLVQEIRIPYTGTLGEYRTFAPHNVASRSFDFQGQWKCSDVKKQYVGLPDYPVKLFQMALHNGFVRLSLVFNSNYRQKAEVFRTSGHILVRLTATEDENANRGTVPASQKDVQPESMGRGH